jgi:hypothetical protein
MMKIECDFPINQMNLMNAVYEHSLAGFPIWIGICKIKDIFRPRDCFRNRSWLDMVDLDANLGVKILFTSVEMRDCMNFRYKYFRDNGYPHCNKNFAPPEEKGNPVQIKNTTTGEIYPSQKIAANMVGCTEAAMSRHINRLPGAKTLRNMVFERIR